MKLIDTTKLVQFYLGLSKREKWVLYVTMSIVLLLGMDQLVIGPIYRKIHGVDRKIRDTEVNIQQSIRLLGQKDQMLKEAAQYENYTSTPRSAEDEILALLKVVQELANQASVNLLYSKPGGQGGEAKDQGVYQVSLECEGQMDQLVNFFYAIESSKLLLRIEKYTLQPTAKGSSVIKCSAIISRTMMR